MTSSVPVGSSAVTSIVSGVRATRSQRTVYIVLPAYNEEANIPRLLDAMRDAMDDSFLRYQIGRAHV